MEQMTKTKFSSEALNSLLTADPQLKFIPDLISLAKKHIAPERIILFGSRARGDHAKNSDVDLAFFVPDENIKHWPRFVAEIDENLKTLLKLDLVRMDRASEELKTSIAEEGIIIYG